MSQPRITRSNQRNNSYNRNYICYYPKTPSTMSTISNVNQPTILRKFNCPFRTNPNRGCFYENASWNCCFAHNDSSQAIYCNYPQYEDYQLPDLDFSKTCDIPDTVCIHYLMGYCRNSVRSAEGDSSAATGCHFGLHLCAWDIFSSNKSIHSQDPSSTCSSSSAESNEIDLELLEKWYIELMREFVGPDIDHQCSICFDHVLAKRPFTARRFGLLEKCSHHFCADCLTNWRLTNFDCPVCRQVSLRMAISEHYFVQNDARKQTIFDNMPPPSRRRNPADIDMFDDDYEDDDDDDEDYDDDEFYDDDYGDDIPLSTLMSRIDRYYNGEIDDEEGNYHATLQLQSLLSEIS